MGVGIVALALGGGGFIMRDTLFGGSGADSTADSLTGADPGNGVQPLAQQSGESTGTAADTNPIIPPNANPPRNPGNQTNPDTGRRVTSDPVTPTGPTLAEIESQVADFEADLEFVDTPARKAAGERLGRSAWANERLPARVRANAAYLVYSSLAKDASDNADEGARREAKTWLQRAVDLNPRPIWQRILQGL
jgi:hypothetical protein